MSARMLIGFVVCLAIAGAAAAADASREPDPTKTMKVGQWVLYKDAAGIEHKQSIIALEGEGDERVVTFKIEEIRDGEVVDSEDKPMNLAERRTVESEARKIHSEIAYDTEKVTVAGRDFDAVVLSVDYKGKRVRTYMSEEVPVTCVIKVEVDDEGPVVELIDFGG